MARAVWILSNRLLLTMFCNLRPLDFLIAKVFALPVLFLLDNLPQSGPRLLRLFLLPSISVFFLDLFLPLLLTAHLNDHMLRSLLGLLLPLLPHLQRLRLLHMLYPISLH